MPKADGQLTKRTTTTKITKATKYSFMFFVSFVHCVTFVVIGEQPANSRWTALTTGVTARLRGVSAVSDRVVWASGASGTVIRTTDGGETWTTLSVPGSETLDFRDIDAVDDKTAYVLSIGPGEQSRIYKTADAGATWTEQFVNHDAKAFYDAMAFWNANHGVAVSDSVDGQFVVITTNDGGRSWVRVPPAPLPPALASEGFFAASGTNVAVLPPNHVWFGTGSATQARVLHSSDGGRTWSMSTTPLASGPSAGIFSIAFSDALHGVIVGGDYKLESAAVENAAITTDGGKSWTPVKGLSGLRSVVAFVTGDGQSLVAVGPSGTDFSTDRGKTWTAIAGPGFHAFSIAPHGRVGFGVGEKGTAGRLGL
jgi:photosystem II stability/assembly factor-like uncharacterized protein